MQDARAAQYHRSSEACALKAKDRGSNAVEWTRLADEWKKLARASEGILVITNHVKIEQEQRRTARGGLPL
jgi:hypothetical protein